MPKALNDEHPPVNWEAKDLCVAIRDAGAHLSDADFEKVAEEVGKQDKALEGMLRAIRNNVVGLTAPACTHEHVEFDEGWHGDDECGSWDVVVRCVDCSAELHYDEIVGKYKIKRG